MTFMINIGKWGGIYFHNTGELNGSIRLCLGWVAFTFFPYDLDEKLIKLVEIKKNQDKEESSDTR